MKHGDKVTVELASVSDLSRSELLKRWPKTHKHSPPKGISRRLLEYSANWQIQVKASGGLKRSVVRSLKAGEGSSVKTDKVSVKPKSGALQIGTRLVREWQGKTYIVDVVENGFIWDGNHCRSLSQIANAITGTRWSGPRFFGL